jgi:hypothetical protein
MKDHWNVLYPISVFYVDRKSKMAATAGHRLTLNPMGKCSNAFFSETTNMIKAKLYKNDVEYPPGTKNRQFVEDHSRKILAKFGSNWSSGFGEEA